MLRLFGDRARTKAVDLCAAVAMPEGTRVSADPVRLGQVLGNLVNNALKFTEAGGVTLRLAMDGTDRLRFSVEDTGIGIAADKLDSIFDSFSQAEQTTTRHFGGTGLGLSIARQLVDAMGGTLTVTSQVGVGSVFSFSLPLASGVSEASDATLPTLALRALIATPLRHTAEAMAASLSAAGLQVTLMDALPQTIAADVSLVIAAPDMLRGKHGASLAREGLAILVLAGDSDPVADLVGTVADDALAWPVQRRDLHRVIARLGEGRPLRAPAAVASVATLGSFAGLRVLVADDSAVNREVADAALVRLGISAHFVDDGLQAVAAATTATFDLILMDGSMPGLDGFDACRAIRAHEAQQGLPRTPIVALSAHVVGAGADAWRAAGMDDMIHKPFTLAQLSACIARIVGERPQEVSLAAEAATGSQDWHAQDRRSQHRRSEDRRSKDQDPDDQVSADLDRTVLRELLDMTGGNLATVERITELFRTKSSQTLEELVAASAAGDAEAIARCAHALKSMSANMGARGVAEAAAAMERSRASRVPEAQIEALRGLLAQTQSLLGEDLRSA